MSAPPSTFTFLGKPWTISLDDRLDDDDELGNMLGFKCAVTYGKDAAVNLGQFRDTVMHEIEHAIFYEAGLASELKESENPGGPQVTEEMIVRRATTLRLALYRENPDLVAWFMAADAPKRKRK